MFTTFHTYGDLVHVGGRLAATTWDAWDGTATAADAVAATLRYHHDAVILRVTDDNRGCVVRGYAPGGLA